MSDDENAELVHDWESDCYVLRDEITRLRADLAAVTEERDALLARLAPVEDKELVEIVAHFEAKFDGWPFNVLERLTQDLYRLRARDFLAAIRPHIEAAERERCAEEIDEYRRHYGGNWPALVTLATAIRSGK